MADSHITQKGAARGRAAMQNVSRSFIHAGKAVKCLKPVDPEVDWPDSCRDVHRVFGVAQSLYLTLNQHDEGVLRVALELITAKKSQHISRWMEDWYDDDARRGWFEKAVKEQLQKVLDVRTGSETAKPGFVEEEELTASNEALKVALARAEAAEASLAELESKMRRAALLSGDSVGRAEEQRQQIQQKDDQIKNLQEKLKEANVSREELKGEIHDQKAAIEEALRCKAFAEQSMRDRIARIKELDEDIGKLQEELKKTRTESHEHANKAAEHAKEAAALQKEIESLRAGQAQVPELENRIKKLTAELQKEKEAGDAARAKAGDLYSISATAAAAAKKVAELEAEKEELHKKTAALEASSSRLEAKCAGLEAEKVATKKEKPPAAKVLRSAFAQTDAVEVPKRKVSLPTEPVAEEKPKARIVEAGPSKQVNEEMQHKIDDLTKENRRLTVMLEELQQKLKELSKACTDQGVDVEDIIAKLDLHAVLKAPSVWERLYDEAGHRIARMERRRQRHYAEHKEHLLPGVNIMEELEESNLVNELPAPPVPRVSIHELAISIPEQFIYKESPRNDTYPLSHKRLGVVESPILEHPSEAQIALAVRPWRPAGITPGEELMLPASMRAHAHQIVGKQPEGNVLRRQPATLQKEAKVMYKNFDKVQRSIEKLCDRQSDIQAEFARTTADMAMLKEQLGTMTKGQQPEQYAEHSETSPDFGRQRKKAHPSGVHSHYVRKRAAGSKLGSSLGFYSASAIVLSQSRTGTFSNIAQPRMRSSKSDIKVTDREGVPMSKLHERKHTGNDRMSATLPSEAAGNFSE